MQVEYRSNLKHRFMVVTVSSSEGNDYRIRMITENEIKGLLSCDAEYMNGDKLLYYDVTGKTTLSEYLKNNYANEKLYRCLLKGVAEAAEAVQEFLLDPNGIVLKPEFIFTDPELKNISCVYYPDNKKDFKDNCRELSEKLLHYIDHDDREGVEIGYGFYKNCVHGNITTDMIKSAAAGRLTNRRQTEEFDQKYMAENKMKPDIAEEKLKGSKVSEDKEDYDFLFSDEETAVKEKRNTGVFGKLFKVKEKKKTYRTGRSGRLNADIQEEYKENTSRNLSRETGRVSDGYYNSESLETTYLKKDFERSRIKALLIPEKDVNSEELMLVKDNYLIGKKIAGAEIVLNSPAVSRAHAKLIWRNGVYCIIDLGSKNGTKINGERIGEGEHIILRDGDRLMFADTGCIYKQT